MPFFLYAATAAVRAAGVAGKTIPDLPTTVWHASEARYATHLRAPALLSEALVMESARPFIIVARLPVGPVGVTAVLMSMPLKPAYVEIIQAPSKAVAALPAATWVLAWLDWTL